MTIEQAKICSNCRKEVPKNCDGRVFVPEGWSRSVCKGSDGESFLEIDGQLRFKVVMGHGCSYDVNLTEIS
jgi:hypothetical protein